MTKITTTPKLTSARRAFAQRLPLVMVEAHRLGLHRTGHALHDAVQKVGYEISDCETGRQHTAPKEAK